MIFGVGVDLLHLPRIKSSVERFGSRFVHKVLHPKEVKEWEKLQGDTKVRFVGSRCALDFRFRVCKKKAVNGNVTL